MKKSMIFFVLMMFTILSCNNKNKEVLDDNNPDSQIVILYDNDVHCAVDGYAKLVAQRDLMLSKNKYVTTVSCGDFVNGGVVGAASEGELIIDIMNEVGYDVVAIGNHELDFGMEQMFNLTERLNSDVVCANLKNIQTNEYVYPAYKMINYGDVDVAFIGFTTTTSGTVVSLADENGNPLYTFMRGEFYQNAQDVIDEVRAEGAEYVIALAHLGDTDKVGGHPSSVNLITNTNGIDAVIDGHDHHVIDQRFVMNKDGKNVLLTSSGTAFQYVGKLTINTDGSLSSSVIDINTATSPVDNEVQQFVDAVKEEVEVSGQKVIGRSEVYLTMYDEEGYNAVRCTETNIGNFCADAFRVFTNADIAVINGGGIRTDINIGDITFNDILAVMPFGNMTYTATMTGQQLMDALEFSVSSLPELFGGFLQVSGMKFNVNPNIPSPVVMDFENDLFSHVGDGERRVSNLQILDTESDTYQDVDLNHTYTIASFDYLILEFGNSGILRYADPIDTYFGTDLETLIFFIEETLGGVIGSEYENVEGRINIE